MLHPKPPPNNKLDAATVSRLEEMIAAHDGLFAAVGPDAVRLTGLADTVIADMLNDACHGLQDGQHTVVRLRLRKGRTILLGMRRRARVIEIGSRRDFAMLDAALD
jgi:hypothetical protein